MFLGREDVLIGVEDIDALQQRGWRQLHPDSVRAVSWGPVEGVLECLGETGVRPAALEGHHGTAGACLDARSNCRQATFFPHGCGRSPSKCPENGAQCRILGNLEGLEGGDREPWETGGAVVYNRADTHHIKCAQHLL